MRRLREHEGVTCTLELAFDYDSRLYVYEMQPDWFTEFLNIEDEILSHFGMGEDEDVDDDDGSLGGYYLQELSCWLLPADQSRAAGGEPAIVPGHWRAGRARAGGARASRTWMPRGAFSRRRSTICTIRSLMRDMPRAVERLARAIRASEKILIYGDYDVDGTSSVVLLTKAIELAGGAANYHVPHRLKDGYGMRAEVVEAAAAQGVKLIVSVDTGIRAAEVVARANELGIDVIVTDHHLPEAELPPAVAVLNPEPARLRISRKRSLRRGRGVQAGAGAVGRARLAFGGKLRRIAESLLKMVAIATVADVVPLTGENRVMVKHGLDGLRAVRNPGLRALLDVAGFADGTAPSSRQVGFQIAPRLNAAGRMDTAQHGDRDVPHQRSGARPRRSRGSFTIKTPSGSKWKRKSATSASRSTCPRAPPRWCITPKTGIAACWASSPAAWWSGLHRPVFVLGRNQEDGLAQGSGRSIPAFHLLDALESMPDLFVQIRRPQPRRRRDARSRARGGIPRALQRLRAGAISARRFAAAPARSTRCWNCVRSTDAAVDEIFTLAPFGHGNPPPLFAALDVEIAAAACDSEGEAPAPDRTAERPLAHAESLELRGARGGTRAGRARGYRIFH